MARPQRQRPREWVCPAAQRVLPSPTFAGWTFVRGIQESHQEIYEKDGTTMDLCPTTGTVVLRFRDADSRVQQRVYRACEHELFLRICHYLDDESDSDSESDADAPFQGLAAVSVTSVARPDAFSQQLRIRAFKRAHIPSSHHGLSLGVALNALKRVNARLANWTLNEETDLIPLTLELTDDVDASIGDLRLEKVSLVSMGRYSKALAATRRGKRKRKKKKNSAFATCCALPSRYERICKRGESFKLRLQLSAFPVNDDLPLGEALVVRAECLDRRGRRHAWFTVLNVRAVPLTVRPEAAALFPTAPYEAKRKAEYFAPAEKASEKDYVLRPRLQGGVRPRLHPRTKPLSMKTCLDALERQETQTLAAMERSETPELSIADRLGFAETQLHLRWNASIKAMNEFDELNVGITPVGTHLYRCPIVGLTESRLGVSVGDHCIVRPQGGEKTFTAIVAQVERDEIVFSASKMGAGVRAVCIRFQSNPYSFRAQLKALQNDGLDVYGMFDEHTTWSRPAALAITAQLKTTLGIALDPSQEAAVRAVSVDSGISRLQLVFGPPGTGKSSTLVAALYLLAARGARVLVCAPSNEAVDLLVKRFLAVLKRSPSAHGVRDLAKRKLLLRIQAAGRHPAFVDPDVLAISPKKTQSGFERPLRRDVEAAQVIFTTCVSACAVPLSDDSDAASGGFDCILIDEAGNTCETESLIPLALATKRTTRFALFGDWQQLRPVVIGHETIDDKAPFLTSVLGEMVERRPVRTDRVDEESRSEVEQEEEEHARARHASVSSASSEWEVVDDIVFGQESPSAAAAAAAAPGVERAFPPAADDLEEEELRPKGFAHWIGVNPRISLLERCHLEARRDSHETDVQRPLRVSYRMDPGVCDTVSRMFYDGDVRSHSAHNTQGLRFLQDLDFNLLQGLPAWASVREGRADNASRMFFLDTEGEETREKGSPSWFNVWEVLRVASLMRAIAASAVASSERVTVAVLSPYRKQTTKIKSLLRSVPNVELLDDPRNRYGRNRDRVQTATGVVAQVGSAEMLQGQEADIVIVSTVRSSPMHFADDRRFALGFVADPKRMNVAISRARYLVVVIGSRDTLSVDPTWNAFIGLCESSGALLQADELFVDDAASSSE